MDLTCGGVLYSSNHFHSILCFKPEPCDVPVSPEYSERKGDSAVLSLRSSTSVPLSPGCMEVSLVMLTLPQGTTSGWRESAGSTCTMAKSMVSLNLLFHRETFPNGQEQHLVLGQCKTQRRESFWDRGWATFKKFI